MDVSEQADPIHTVVGFCPTPAIDHNTKAPSEYSNEPFEFPHKIPMVAAAPKLTKVGEDTSNTDIPIGQLEEHPIFQSILTLGSATNFGEKYVEHTLSMKICGHSRADWKLLKLVYMMPEKIIP